MKNLCWLMLFFGFLNTAHAQWKFIGGQARDTGWLHHVILEVFVSEQAHQASILGSCTARASKRWRTSTGEYFSWTSGLICSDVTLEVYM